MTSVDLIRACLDSIRQISDDIVDSILYLDAGCLEAFQFIGAFPLFLELGACAICSLESMSSLDITAHWNSNFIPVKRMVVITSHLLSDAHRYILHCLASHQTILHCIIFTAISELAHSAYADSPLGPDAFHEYESLLVQDYEEIVMKRKSSENHSHLNNETEQAAGGDHLDTLSSNGDGSSQLASRMDDDLNVESVSGERDLFDDSKSTEVNTLKNLQVIVNHYPMLLCPVSAKVFVFPSEGAVAEACLSNNNESSVSPGLPSFCTGLPSDGEDVSPGVTLTAHFLYNFAAKMDLKMEIFSLGDTSKVIGKMLTDMSSLYDVGRRNRRSAGLLLIDRTLDLLTPCCHGDSFLDRMLSSLPRRDRAISSSAMKSSQSLNKNHPANVHHATLDIRIPFSKILSYKDSNTATSKLEENIKAFMSGWNLADVDSEPSDLSDNAYKLQNNKFDNELYSLSGSFLSNHMGTNYLEALLDGRMKDGILLIKKWLMEALQHEKMPSKGFTGSTTLSEFHTMVKKLVPDQVSLIRNREIIQLALAAEMALSEPHGSRWDAFVSAERILNINSLDSSQNLSSQIRDLINTSSVVRSHEDHNTQTHAGLFSFQDALLLSIAGYILAGENFPTSGSGSPFSWEEEHSLKEAIVDAIFQNPKMAKLQFLHGLEKDLEANTRKEESSNNEDDFDDHWGSWDDEETDHQNEQAYGNVQLKLELRDRVDQLFKLFHKLSGLKWRTQSLIEGPLTSPTGYGNDPCARKGLIYKLLSTVMAKYDIPGLEYHSSAVGRFFKSGFGRFGIGQAKPSLGDQSVILIFVVGGINCLEIREAMEAISESRRSDLELLIGATTLLIPDDMYDLLLGSSSYI